MEGFFDGLLPIAGLSAAIAAAIGVFLGVLFSSLDRMRLGSRYDDARKKAELETMRRYYEEKIYGLNDRMLSSPDRWRDANHFLRSYLHRPDDFDVPTDGPRQLTQFLKQAGVTERDLFVDRNLVLVLTPFHPKYDDAFHAIARACQRLNMRCLRGDETYVSGDLVPHILKLILQARIVVANVDGRNPNVFYELGLCHALDKPTLIVTSDLPSDLPIDLRSKKLVVYEAPEDLMLKLQDELARFFAGSGSEF